MSDEVTIRINNCPRQVARGTLLAVALAAAGETRFRRSITGQPRRALVWHGHLL
jgi:2Fe-2S iron-sulfur cluster binding domain